MSCRVTLDCDDGFSSSYSSRISVGYVNTVLERLKQRQTRDSTAKKIT